MEQPDIIENNKEKQENNSEIKRIDKVIEEVTKYGWLLKDLSEEDKNNKKIVLAAMKSWGRGLEHVSEDLKNDKEVVSAAVTETKEAFDYASEDLKNDKEFILDILEKNPFVIAYLPEKLINDREIVLATVKIHGDMIKHTKFLDDEEIVEAAFNHSKSSLRYVSERLQKKFKEID